MGMTQAEKDFLQTAFPFWKELSQNQKERLLNSTALHHYQKGEHLHSGSNDCVGTLAVQSGQLRAYLMSDQGKEVTLYRLLEGDVCILSASCILKNITFDVYIDAEAESDVFIVSSAVYDQINRENRAAERFTNQIISERFSEVMWVMEQVMFMSFDKRLALFLIEQSSIEQSDTITLTHDAIAKHLGSTREVVSRMLKYFAGEGILSVSRGGIRILDRKRLQNITK